MQTNIAVSYSATTHEGGRADPHQSPMLELERAVSTCLLWENTFYEKGNDIAARMAGLCTQVAPSEIAALAVKARTDMKLRHVPLFLCIQLLKMKTGRLAGDTIAQVVKRPDEMGELIALYRKEKRIPLAAQLKKGLARVFPTFSPYQLAKWNKNAAVKLRDVLFLVHAKPQDAAQAAVWKQLVDGTLESPDTWEVALSSGTDKKETWTRLLSEKKLGYMALLMNLRNMSEVGVDPLLVESALREGAKDSKALPFRFISAYKHVPQYAQALSDAMELAVEGALSGTTALLLDVSVSMNTAISDKGELKRYETAAALAVLVRGLSKSCRIFAYATSMGEIANIRGLGLIDAVKHGMDTLGGNTNTAKALQKLQELCPSVDRVILLTDEQAHDGIHPLWAKHGYIINVAPYKPGLETGTGWVRINGWSERVIDWIKQHEGNDDCKERM